MSKTKRMTMRKTDERMRLIDRAKGIIQKDEYDEPPDSKAIDAALEHFVQSHENLEDARRNNELADYDVRTVRDLVNTDVLRVHYRTQIDQHFR